jgi:hypothetical protein
MSESSCWSRPVGPRRSPVSSPVSSHEGGSPVPERVSGPWSILAPGVVGFQELAFHPQNLVLQYPLDKPGVKRTMRAGAIFQLAGTRAEPLSIGRPHRSRSLRSRRSRSRLHHSSRIVRSRRRSRSGSLKKSSSTILSFRTVTAAIENGCPSREATIPAAPLISAGRMSATRPRA